MELVFIQRSGESISKKKLGYRFRRFSKCIKACQDPEKYEALVKQLCELLYLEEQGYIKLYYGDESGFCMDPCLPYGWQPKEEYIKIAPKKSKRYSVFGLLSKDNHLQAYASEQTMNADMIIAFLDDFISELTQKTVIVLDNAPIHHAKQFKEKIAQWQKQDLYLFFLPTYSPHLNLIETLWRKAKYEWLKPQDYLSWDSLTTAVDNIMSNVGNTFSINFNELNHYTQCKTSFIFD